jgi:hypothetical protein
LCRSSGEWKDALIESLEADITGNALACLKWALAMLKEHPILGTLGWVATATIPAILLDVALERIVKKIRR